MFSFIKRHWIAYLIGAIVAIALGFGLSYFVGVVGSTPESERTERSETEQEQDVSSDQIVLDDDDSGQDQGVSENDTTAGDTEEEGAE